MESAKTLGHVVTARMRGEARTLRRRVSFFVTPAMLRHLTALALLGTAAGARPNIMMILVVR